MFVPTAQVSAEASLELSPPSRFAGGINPQEGDLEIRRNRREWNQRPQSVLPALKALGVGPLLVPLTPVGVRTDDPRKRDRAAVKKTKVLTEILGRAPTGPHYLLEKERNEMFYLMSLNMGSVKLLCGTGVRTQGPSL